MQQWRNFPELAEFPGTIAVGDARDEDSTYKSSNVRPDTLSSLEPQLSPEAAAQPLRLYSQEGTACFDPLTPTPPPPPFSGRLLQLRILSPHRHRKLLLVAVYLTSTACSVAAVSRLCHERL